MSSSGFAPPVVDGNLAPLRDWFAGQALSGMIPSPRVPGVLPMTLDETARAAYAYADALLRVRTEPVKVK
jgi:hypothetical protein